jgi:transcriptional regulator
MYCPAHFAVDEPAVLRGLIANHPLATVIVQRDGELDINPVPMLFDPDHGEHGRLIGHVAHKNPLADCDGQRAFALFHGPNAYVSPNWYPGKQTHGKVVPTWNYAVIEARGTLRCANAPDRVLAVVDALTQHFEADQARPWTVADAPRDYIDIMLGAITSIELTLDALHGKFKLSQNRPEADQQGIAQALQASRHDAPKAVGRMMDR